MAHCFWTGAALARRPVCLAGHQRATDGSGGHPDGIGSCITHCYTHSDGVANIVSRRADKGIVHVTAPDVDFHASADPNVGSDRDASTHGDADHHAHARTDCASGFRSSIERYDRRHLIVAAANADADYLTT